VFTKNGTAARHRIGAQATGLSVEDARPATGAPSGSDHIKAGDLDLRPGLQQLFGVRRGQAGVLKARPVHQDLTALTVGCCGSIWISMCTSTAAAHIPRTTSGPPG